MEKENSLEFFAVTECNSIVVSMFRDASPAQGAAEKKRKKKGSRAVTPIDRRGDYHHKQTSPTFPRRSSLEQHHHAGNKRQVQGAQVIHQRSVKAQSHMGEAEAHKITGSAKLVSEFVCPLSPRA